MLLQNEFDGAAPSLVVETPLMKQYLDLKKSHPDAILLFRVGDFYEMFSEDAIKASKLLGITLTRRANGAASFVELAGFPFHALDAYLPKLVRAGQRVAICEQLEDPKKTKKLVKRGITELVTPGLTLNDNLLSHRENNFLASLFYGSNAEIGLALLDLSTGEFLTAQGTVAYVDKLLGAFQPREVLYQKGFQKQLSELFSNYNFSLFALDDWVYSIENAQERLVKHFKVKNLKGFGIQQLNEAIIASGAILCYLDITQYNNLNHIATLSRIEEERYVWLDRFTIRNLELVQPLCEDGRTLLEVIDKTVTPMGSRLLRRWITLPLKDAEAVNERLSAVSELTGNALLLQGLTLKLKPIGDLERLISKVAVLKVTPRDLMQIATALQAIEALKQQCSNEVEAMPLKRIADQLNSCSYLFEHLTKSLVSNPPAQLHKGPSIAQGLSAELDELRGLLTSGKNYLNNLQESEIEKTGISTLKIGFNNVFGYYIEIRNAHKNKVPDHWIRKQTLVGAERYITEELKVYEQKILGAEAKIMEIEASIFQELINTTAEYTAPIQLNANILALLDCLCSHAQVALANNYTKPVVNNDMLLEIECGRHPVIEQQLPPQQPYIANDTVLNHTDQQILLITGPNMAGKSALLRQTALIVILAQIGCFVPAQKATIGIIDKVFTRVGASDNIASGESTFMVEMTEAASILNNLSDRSLVLLDELGRGTSTYDGISIAQAIVEYIHENSFAKTLFATHYHELSDLEHNFERIKNFSIAIHETGSSIVFLRKLIPGSSAHSFGIHVASMAGVPACVVKRANQLLQILEQKPGPQTANSKSAKHNSGALQLSFFEVKDPVLVQINELLQNINPNTLTPIEALVKLNELKKLIESQ